MDGTRPELCAECGFDSRDWLRRDAATLLDDQGYWWRLATEGIPAAELNRRPSPLVWSALEYGFHTSLVTGFIRAGVEMIRDQDGCSLPAVPAAGEVDSTPVSLLDPGSVAADFEREGKALAAVARGPDGWDHLGRLPDGTVLQAEALLVHCVHDASHHQMDIARGLAAIGAGTPEGAGSVVQVNVSDGGVPKLPVTEADIGRRGLSGDRQATRKHHGRPFQAACLWSLEVLDELARSGHPIRPGAAGENVTVSGLEWPSLRSGSLLRVGSALVELSYPATPCQKQTRWFLDGDFRRIDHDLHPGTARWYGWVREPGHVRAGDAVIVQP
ncbi:MAG TPA: MOSC domain-containing protein [Acidimicrobiales bacterium]|nr:MOSC domain-containing protein [Acidimicrobiales bacterium]